jgi:putative SOS response-associated peptidase YedK
MPVILPEEVHEAWLSGEAGKEVLTPFPAERMKAFPISTRVNFPRNNDRAIIDPVQNLSDRQSPGVLAIKHFILV